LPITATAAAAGTNYHNCALQWVMYGMDASQRCQL